MQNNRFSWVMLTLSALFIKIVSYFPQVIEQYYANGIYPSIARFQRILFGWIPFSVGDLFYVACFLYCLRKGVLLLKAVVKKRVTATIWISAAKKVVFICLWIYVLFNLFWGLNYNRLPMARQMGLDLERYSTGNLSMLLQLITIQLNSIDSTSQAYTGPLKRKRVLFAESVDSYNLAAKKYPALLYRTASVKPSIFSYAGNYLGFTGYYNPFSGEAQSNTTVPVFVQPFVTCHEIGHQLGYAKENEANFAGFLAARSSSNPAFRYSLYFDMYSYASRELYRRDSTLARAQYNRLNPGVQRDYETIRIFYRRYANPLEPLISMMYGRFLKANEQPQGLRSYNEVVAMMLAYYKKYKEI